ncbi:hypothetical protein GCM10009665_22120 [Kitasatospora nipponensis]|uniref:Uncharacterized protein n=1 Tax=Kitasatospora nipponensis TaxID=258049 RepID=A0ABP4GNB1_9ACTN
MSSEPGTARTGSAVTGSGAAGSGGPAGVGAVRAMRRAQELPGAVGRGRTRSGHRKPGAGRSSHQVVDPPSKTSLVPVT